METNGYRSDLGEFSTQLAILCFGVGTLLFLLGLVFNADVILLIGYVYVILALFLNFIVMLSLIFHCVLTKQYEYYGKKLLILVANIPIAIGYFYVIVYICFKSNLL